MTDAASPIRERYWPDQQMNWGLLPALILAPVAFSIGVGAALHTASANGWYYYFVVPGAGAILLAGVLMLAVNVSHCRIRRLAGAIGLLSGVLAYLAMYYFDMLAELPGGAHRVDLLPAYIRHRLMTDLFVNGPPGNFRPQQPAMMDHVFVTVIALAELAIFIVIPMGLAMKRASRPYCLELSQWMRHEEFPIDASVGLLATELLTQGNPAGAADALSVPCTDDRSPHRCAIDFVDHAEYSPLEYPVYFTAEFSGGRGVTAVFKPFAADELIQSRLTLPEAVELQRLFPKFKARIAQIHPELQPVVTEASA